MLKKTQHFNLIGSLPLVHEDQFTTIDSLQNQTSEWNIAAHSTVSYGS